MTTKCQEFVRDCRFRAGKLCMVLTSGPEDGEKHLSLQPQKGFKTSGWDWVPPLSPLAHLTILPTPFHDPVLGQPFHEAFLEFSLLP